MTEKHGQTPNKLDSVYSNAEMIHRRALLVVLVAYMIVLAACEPLSQAQLDIFTIEKIVANEGVSLPVGASNPSVVLSMQTDGGVAWVGYSTSVADDGSVTVFLTRETMIKVGEQHRKVLQNVVDAGEFQEGSLIQFSTSSVLEALDIVVPDNFQDGVIEVRVGSQ